MRLWLGSFFETQSTDEETMYEDERTVKVNETLVQLYQTSTYYLETCLRIQPVVDSFEKSAQVQYMKNGPAIDYQSSFWRQVWVNHMYAEPLPKAYPGPQKQLRWRALQQ